MASNDQQRVAPLIRSAMAGAAVLVAHLVVAKAARDALFLDRFPATDLPKIVAAAALVAILNGVLFARLSVRRGPASILPATLAVSAASHLAEYALIGPFRGPVVVLAYLHIISSSSIALSMFWSIANEAFSPREAKRYFGRITAAGTAGGVAGGLLAERVTSFASIEALLLLLAVLHAGAFVIALVLARQSGVHSAASDGSAEFVATVRSAVSQAPFLKSLALLVFCLTIGGALVDFVFKSGAVSVWGTGESLARFFLFFYTGTQVATFLLQAAVTPLALKSLGLGRTVMTLPAVLAAGGAVAAGFPVFAVVASTRVGEAVLNGSLFRAGYELFFTPIPQSQKRAVKTAIDVGSDRAGEILGAGLIQLFLLMGLEAATRPLLLLVVAFAGVCIWISSRMDPAYLRALEQGLLHRAVELREDDVQDSTTLSALLKSVPRLRAQAPRPPSGQAAGAAAPLVSREPAALAEPSDPAMQTLAALRSGVAAEVRRTLSADQPFEPIVVPQVIRLLAWDEVTDAARHYLQRHGDKVAGQLADTLLDTQQDFSVRRRTPRILAQHPAQRVVEALEEALRDARFEIRFQSGRALEFVHRSNPSLRFDRELLMSVVDKELSVSRTIWEGRRLLDSRDESDTQYTYLDEVVRGRAHQSTEHVFSLLAIVLPREPLKLAFRALHSHDRVLKGLGLEYLETALPATTFALFRTMLEAGPAVSSARPPQQVLEALMASQETIRLQLAPQSAGAGEPEPPPRSATTP